MILALAVATLLRQSPKSTPYSTTWARISNQISTSYFARKTRKGEVVRLLAKYKPLAKSATSNEAFVSAVRAMTQEFGDSHFDLFSSDEQGYYMMNAISSDVPLAMPEFGAWFKKGPDGYAVSMVLDGSQAAKASLRKGDIVQSVDGDPFSPITSLRHRVGKTVHLGILRNGRPSAANVVVSSSRALDMFLNATSASSHVITAGGRKIGYFHLWTETNNSFRDALSTAVYGTLANTDAIILDVRDGFGGFPQGFADPFFRPDVTMNFGEDGTENPTLFGYQKPLILLTDGGTRSAEEMLSYILKKSKRATLVGTRTAGNVLAAQSLRVSDWAYLEMPVSQVLMDGKRLERIGVEPDIEVSPEIDASGKDLVLARALQELSAKS